MDTIVKLIMQTSERSTAMKAQSVIASDHNYLKSCAVTSSLAECEHLSMDAQLWECRAHFAPHVAVSLERTIQRCNDYLVEPGHINGFVVTTSKAGCCQDFFVAILHLPHIREQAIHLTLTKRQT